MNDDIIRKIKALIAKAASTNSEAEALGCAAKAQELMAKYNVSEAQVSDETIGEMPKNKRIADEWRRWLASSTARLFNCSLLIEHFARPYKTGGTGWDRCWTFVGREGDRITADLMTDYFIGAVVRLANEHRRETGCGQNEWRQFAKACALRLSQRIHKMSGEVADQKQLALVDEAIAAMDLGKARKAKQIQLSGDAAKAGFAKGNDVGLNLQATGNGAGGLRISQALAIKGK